MLFEINQVVGKRWGRYILNWGGGGGRGGGEGGRGFSGESHHTNWEPWGGSTFLNLKGKEGSSHFFYWHV